MLTLEGTATLDQEPINADERSSYLAKYDEVISGAGFTPDGLFEYFSSVIRIAPSRVRIY